MSKIRTIAVTAAAVLAAGLGATGVQSVAHPNKAEAFIVAYRVSDSSERSIRICDLADGHGLCDTIKPGKYSMKYSVVSDRQDAGCEYWSGGVRKYKRSDRPQWHNHIGLISKATVALRNCRSTGRGDKVS